MTPHPPPPIDWPDPLTLSLGGSILLALLSFLYPVLASAAATLSALALAASLLHLSPAGPNEDRRLTRAAALTYGAGAAAWAAFLLLPGWPVAIRALLLALASAFLARRLAGRTPGGTP